MKFSKQIKSLDRRFYYLRNKYRLFEKLYNHFNKINLHNSFHSSIDKQQLKVKAETSIDALLAPTKMHSNSRDIPKKVWLFWDSGLDSAPEVVKLSVRSWQEMNPDYDVNVLTNDNLNEFLGFDFYSMFQLSTVRCLPPTKADILRLHLLSKHGGVWADATTFCLQPLDSWIHEATSHCGLFTFKQRDAATRPVEAWFIAAPQSSKIINQVLEMYIDYIFAQRKQSLFISGKVSLLDKVIDNDQFPLDTSASKHAESFGFMPYFTIGYVFYEVLRAELSAEQLANFLRLDDKNTIPNNHALTKDGFDIFEQAVVSKQTYTRSYSNSDLFQKRKAKLIENLEKCKK